MADFVQMRSQFDGLGEIRAAHQRKLEDEKEIKRYERALSTNQGRIKTVRRMVLNHPSWLNKCLVIRIPSWWLMASDAFVFVLFTKTIQHCSFTTASGTHFMLPPLKGSCRKWCGYCNKRILMWTFPTRCVWCSVITRCAGLFKPEHWQLDAHHPCSTTLEQSNWQWLGTLTQALPKRCCVPVQVSIT